MIITMKFLFGFSLVFILTLLPGGDALAYDLINLNSRKDVTQSFMLIKPIGTPIGAAIMFPTEEGNVKFKKKSRGYKIKKGGWYGNKHRMFTENGLWLAFVEPPSDQIHGIDTRFRQSENHVKDIAAVVAEVERRSGFKPFLMGTCRGSYSAASVGSKIDNGSISGVVLISTRSRARDGSVVRGARKGGLTAPLMMIHHEDDDCKGSPYSGMKSIAGFFEKSSDRVETLTVKGGWQSSGLKQKKGCGKNGSHKFFGSEKEIVDAIADWVVGKEIPSVLETGL